MTTGNELYAWQVLEPGGDWSIVAAGLSADHQWPLIHRSHEIIQELKPFAVTHATATKQQLRLARFTLSDVLEGPGV